MRIHNEVYGTTFTTRIAMNRGEGLAEHTHDASSNHFTICLRGACLFIEPDKKTLVKAAELYAPEDNVPHTVIALEDGTEIIHIQRQEFTQDWMRRGDGGVTEDHSTPLLTIPEGY